MIEKDQNTDHKPGRICDFQNRYAARLILHSIHFAVLHGLRIRANCPAAEAYIKRNPEWSYILSECVNA